MKNEIMKKKYNKIFNIYSLGFLLIFLIFIYSANAQKDNEKLFQDANAFYRENKFEEALQIYLELNKNYPNNPVFLYNAANTYANLGKRGEAVLMLERARRLIPRDSDLQENLKKLSPPINNPEIFLLFKPLAFIKNTLSLNEWTFLLSVFWFLVLIAFSFKILFRHQSVSKIFNYLGWNFVILLIIISCFWGTKFYQQEMRIELILLEDGVMAKSGPGEDFAQSIQQPLPVGAKLIQIGNPEQDWIRVRVLGGSAGGWVPASSVQKIRTD